jgi:hypothetical protein
LRNLHNHAPRQRAHPKPRKSENQELTALYADFADRRRVARSLLHWDGWYAASGNGTAADCVAQWRAWRRQRCRHGSDARFLDRRAEPLRLGIDADGTSTQSKSLLPESSLLCRRASSLCHSRKIMKEEKPN